VLAYETIVYLALKKYLRKKRVDRGARNRRPAPKAENHSVPDTPESEDIDPDSDIDDQNAEDVMDIQELIDAESHRMREVPKTTIQDSGWMRGRLRILISEDRTERLDNHPGSPTQ
jgi:hypothetical protein